LEALFRRYGLVGAGVIVIHPSGLASNQSMKRRYDRWMEMGILDDMSAVPWREADLEWP
jgi:hypothetical protein